MCQGPLLHLALYGGRLPEWLLCKAVRRLRAEANAKPQVWAPRIALIKIVLLQQQLEHGLQPLDVAITRVAITNAKDAEVVETERIEGERTDCQLHMRNSALWALGAYAG